MITGTLVRMAAGAVALGLLSALLAILSTGTQLAGWPGAFETAKRVLMAVLTLLALVWSTALARRHALAAWPTAALALGIGVTVFFAAALIAELLYPAAWHAVWPAAREPMTLVHDARWVFSKLAECAVYVLPFATWRALQQRHRPVAAGAAAR